MPIREGRGGYGKPWRRSAQAAEGRKHPGVPDDVRLTVTRYRGASHLLKPGTVDLD